MLEWFGNIPSEPSLTVILHIGQSLLVSRCFKIHFLLFKDKLIFISSRIKLLWKIYQKVWPHKILWGSFILFRQNTLKKNISKLKETAFWIEHEQTINRDHLEYRKVVYVYLFQVNLKASSFCKRKIRSRYHS